jgi:hypothetical protein
MHIAPRQSTVSRRCSVCSSLNTEKKTNHIFEIVACKDCEHRFLLTEPKNHSHFMQSHLKKNAIKQQRTGTIANVFEYCYCPYWEAMTLLDKAGIISIQLNRSPDEVIQSHYFSEKSFQIFAQQLGMPTVSKITDNTGFIIINILRHLH